MMRRFIVVSLSMWVAACGQSDAVPQRDVDTLFINAVVWTGVPGAPDASVVAVRDGRIDYVGDGEGVRFAAGETVDLNGRFVMHGFIDNHVHIFYGGEGLAGVPLRDAATPEMFAERIGTFAATVPPGRWVLQGNWDHEQWGGELPHRDWIDARTGDTPVFVLRSDGHMGLANSAALALAGVGRDTPTPDGGEIVRDADGRPTGILKDNAMGLVTAVIPVPSDAERLAAFEAAQAHALSLGLTHVHAVTASPEETWLLDALRLAHERDRMTLRVTVFQPLEHWQPTAEVVAGDGRGDATLRWGGVKGFVDGSLGSTTAWFHEPYTDRPDTSGFALSEPGALRTRLADADSAGLRLAIHAIGDRAIDVLLDQMQEVAGEDIAARRYRIEHFQHPTRAAIERAAALGVIASMQPYHAIDDGRWAEKRIGAARSATTYAFRSILDAGGRLTFGSDWPVAPLSPLQGVYAAVTRRTTDGAHPGGWQPQEKISVEEALTAYTASNAYAGFDEADAGTLEPGKRADLVVLAADPRAVAPEALRELAVAMTVIDGEIVYRAP